MTPSPPVDVGLPRWIGSDAELADACARWRGQSILGLDTEFVRERTFYPALGLVQVAAGDELALVDPLAIDDPSPLTELLADPAVVKVLHSCSEDVEVLHHTFGLVPVAVFDTQIAAAVCGLDYSVGYGRLVHELFGVELPKGETRSNWLKRPLRESQKAYAARDVAYLLPAHRRLAERLAELGRTDWHDEDCRQLTDPARFEVDDQAAYLRIGRSRQLAQRELGVLRALCAWRERQARRRDLPRGFIVRDEALAEIARRKPRSRAQLRRVPGLRPEDLKRHGDRLLALVREACELPTEDLPARPRRALDLSPHKALTQDLRRHVAELAADFGVAPELLANRRTAESLLRRYLEGRRPVLPRRLRDGWREQAVGQPLVAFLDRRSEP